MRVCSVPGCPELTKARRCPAHATAYEQARGTRQQRGYDAQHDADRAKWADLLARRPWPCARCPEQIQPGQPFHLDHNEDRTGYLGPSHAACNTAAGGRAAHATP